MHGAGSLHLPNDGIGGGEGDELGWGNGNGGNILQPFLEGLQRVRNVYTLGVSWVRHMVTMSAKCPKVFCSLYSV